MQLNFYLELLDSNIVKDLTLHTDDFVKSFDYENTLSRNLDFRLRDFSS